MGRTGDARLPTSRLFAFRFGVVLRGELAKKSYDALRRGNETENGQRCTAN